MSTHSSPGYPTASLVPPVEWGGHASHAHSVQFYSDDTFLLDETSRFIGSALGAGDAGLVIAPRAHREGLGRRFGGQGPGPSPGRPHGRRRALGDGPAPGAVTRDPVA